MRNRILTLVLVLSAILSIHVGKVFAQLELSTMAEGLSQCDGLSGDEKELQRCRRIVMSRYSGDDDCPECGLEIYEETQPSPWVEALGIVSGPLAMLGTNWLWSRQYGKVNERWADSYRDVNAGWSNAYTSGHDACTSRFNSYLNYNTTRGANPVTPDQADMLMAACNGQSFGQFTGMAGMGGSAFGGVTNPFLGAGYSPGFMSGMSGPYTGGGGYYPSGGMNMGMPGMSGGLYLSGGSGYYPGGGMNMGMPGMGVGVGIGMGTPGMSYGMGTPGMSYGMGMPGMSYGTGMGMPGMSYGTGMPGMSYGTGMPGMSYGTGMPGAGLGAGLYIGGGLGTGGGYPGMYGGLDPYAGMYGGGGGLPYGGAGYWGGPGMYSGGMGIGGNPMVNGMGGYWGQTGGWGNQAGNWNGQYNQYQDWQQQGVQLNQEAWSRQGALSQAQQKNNSILYQNYMTAGNDLQRNMQSGYGAYYGGSPYAMGNIGGQFGGGAYIGGSVGWGAGGGW